MLGKTFRWSVITVFSVLTLAPLLWLVMSSFKTDAELFGSPFALPETWSLVNYREALSAHPLLTFLRNSVVVALLATVLIVVASLMASYALMHRFRVSRLTFGFLVFGILLPVNALMTPVFFLVNMMGLYNNVLGLALVYAGLFFPLGFLVVKSYMDTTPGEILEAARIDGASFHRIFRDIVGPLTMPGAVTAGIFLMISCWNELLFASILTQDESAQTVQVGIRFFLSSYSANYPVAFAATVVAVAPTIVVYAILSERIVDAMTAGSLK